MPSIELQDGTAERMGDGVFIVFQTDEFGEPQTVVLTEEDLKGMLGL